MNLITQRVAEQPPDAAEQRASMSEPKGRAAKQTHIQPSPLPLTLPPLLQDWCVFPTPSCEGRAELAGRHRRCLGLSLGWLARALLPSRRCFRAAAAGAEGALPGHGARPPARPPARLVVGRPQRRLNGVARMAGLLPRQARLGLGASKGAAHAGVAGAQERERARVAAARAGRCGCGLLARRSRSVMASALA